MNLVVPILRLSRTTTWQSQKSADVVQPREKEGVMNKKAIAVSCFAFVLCFALAGCGGGSASSASAGTGPSSSNSASTSPADASAEAVSDSAEAAKAAFVGTWDMVEIIKDGKTTDKLAIEGMKKNGQDYYATLDGDGTITIVSGTGDNVATGAWEASSVTEGTFAGAGGKKFAMTIADGQLTLDLGSIVAKCEPGEARAELPPTAASSSNAAKSSEASSASAKSSAKYEVSIDDMTVGEDYQGNPALIVTYSWKNNSDKSSSFAATLHPRCYQNGVQLNNAIVLSGIDSEGYLADVKPGAGTSLQMAYELKDTESPVDVEVYEFASFKGDPIISKTYKF